MSRQIAICPHHDDYTMPLIWTFAFVGAEWWCAYCGHTLGMWCEETTEPTMELVRRRERARKHYRLYLHAMGVRVCSRTTWPPGSGQMVKPEELPQEERDRLAEIRRTGWSENVKIEDLCIQPSTKGEGRGR